MSSYPKQWEESVVRDYIKQESQQKTPEVFLETHIPIEKIKAHQLYGSDHVGDTVSEEQLLEHITQSEPDRAENRIYMLKGEVGSGKSHLCQWLEYQINGEGDFEGADEHVAIHISRNNTRLPDILEKLYEHVDAEPDDLADLAELDAEDLANFVVSGLETFGADTERFSEFDLDEFIADDAADPNLRTVLEENIRDYQDAVDKEEREQRIDLIDREEFGHIAMEAFGKTFTNSDVFPVVRNAIHDRLTKNVGIEDFQAELVEVAETYKAEGKRPVLIAEDVTTFTVLKDDLLDYIFQLGDGADEMTSGFDVVLGYTTGWESEQADDALMTGDLSFMTQRAVGYLSLTDEDGEALFLEDGPMPVRLVEQYLDAIKRASDRPSGVAIDEDAFDDLYPFNERVVMRAYRHLQEDDGNRQQTPRLLLYHVIGNALLSNVPPHESLAGNGFIADFSDPTSAHYDTSINNLLKWYGKRDDDTVVVPKTYFETFGEEIPDGARVTDDVVEVDAQYGGEGWLFEDWEVSQDTLDGTVREHSGTSSETEPDTGTGPEPDEDPSTAEVETEEDDSPDAGSGSVETGVTTGDEEDYSETKAAISQFQGWYGSGTDFPSADRLRTGVQAALNWFYDPTRLANPNATTSGTGGFYYARGDDVPVEIEGADASKDLAFSVSPFPDGDPDHERMLQKLTMYGLETPGKDAGEFPDDTNFDAIRGWCDGQVRAFREQMREDLESALNDELTLEEFLVLAHFLYLNAARGETDLDPRSLLRDPGVDHAGTAEVSPFKKGGRGETRENPVDLAPGLVEAYNELSKRRSDLADLCRGFFLLKDNFVDRDRLSTAIDAVREDFENCLDAAARTKVDEVPDAYRIGTSRSNAKVRVSVLFEAVADYANELQKLQQSFDPSAISAEVETVESLYSRRHTAGDLQDAYQQLTESLEPLDVNLQPDWVEVEDVLDEQSDNLNLMDFGDTLERLGQANPDDPTDVVSLLHTYNESTDTQEAWRVYNVLADMMATIESLPDPSVDEFRDQVRDSTAFRDFQTKRDAAVDVLGGI